MNNKSGIRTGIVVLVLLLAVGFAAVTTQLVINGTINIGANTSDFESNVKFHTASATGSANASVTGDTNAAASISSDGKTITFTTQILDTIGETSVLEYDVENGSQYDAQLGDMKCVEGNYNATNFPATATTSFTDTTGHVTVTSNNELTGTTIAKKSGTTPTVSAGKAHVTVTMIKSYVGDDTTTPPTTQKTITFTCMMTANGLSA
jgi:cytochrome c oxidase assembly protein Cox11